MKRALVTGASSGIGQALIPHLEKEGYHCLRSGRKFDDPQDAHIADLSNPIDRQRLVELIQKEVPDLLVNGAGYTLYGDALHFTTQQQLDILEVNATACLELTLEAARALVNAGRKGTIFNISSSACAFPSPGMSVYAASKAFVTNVSKALDYEFRPFGVRVLAIAPGQVATPFAARAAGKPLKHPLGIAMPLEKVARAILKQLKKQKGFQFFDWRYALLSRIIPESLAKKKIRDSIISRL